MIDLRIYLAGGVNRRNELRQLRADLTRLGIVVTSSWLDLDDAYEALDSSSRRQLAEMDLRDVNRSNMLIAMLDAPSTRGGTMVELGYAMGRDGIQGHDFTVGIVGPIASCHNVFVELADHRWPSTRELLAWAEEQANG